ISGAAKLKQQRPNDPAANEAYNRLLLIAVGPPFYDMAFAEEAGKLLLERNIDAMKGNYSVAQGDQMLSDAQRAAELFRKAPDEKRKIYARFFELMTYDQMLDLAPKSPSVSDWNAKVDQIADEVNALANKVIDNATSDDDAKGRARGLKVKTSLL